MGLLEIVAAGLIVAIAVLVAVFGRREFFARTHGAVQISVRLHQRPDGGGWAPGFALYRGDELRWYRLFSLALRPRRTPVAPRPVDREQAGADGAGSPADPA